MIPLFKMSEIANQENRSSLFINEEDSVDDNSTDIVLKEEKFDSSDDSEDVEAKPCAEQNSLKIIEEKDLIMEESEKSDQISLKVDQKVVRMNSNTSNNDFEEAESFDGEIEPHEAVNETVEGSFRRPSESHNDEGEGIVEILGQINDIVGLSVSR